MRISTNLSMSLFLCSFTLVLAGRAGLAFGEEPVQFADPKLKASVEKQLGTSDPTPTDMLALTTLSAGGQRITNLGGIEHATNLEVLTLYGNQVSDISAVGALTSLRRLNLADNQVVDISAVAALTNLVELSLPRNQVKDLSGVAGLTSLTQLYLGYNQIGDITPVAGLANLTHLWLQNNRIRDISPLLDLTNLAYVDLRQNPLSQVSCDTCIARIRENNPGAIIDCSPFVQYTLTISSTPGGSVSVPGEGVFTYDYGGTHPIAAVADPGYHFLFWTGTATGARRVANVIAAATEVSVRSNGDLKACFAPDKPVICVDADANGVNDGSSWRDAYVHLQDALTDANSSPKPVEIRVAGGVYRPDRGVGIQPGSRAAAFRLISGVTLEGGYAGVGAPDPNARDIRLFKAILSGDLEGDDTGTFDGRDDDDYDPMWTDNSVHVVTAEDVDESAVLDGFQITGGYDRRSPTITGGGPTGGGAVIRGASPMLIDCTFTSNVVTGSGGAIVALGRSGATLVNCEFVHNFSYNGGAICVSNSTLSLADCRFYDNIAGNGGAILCTVSDLNATGCQFRGNVGRYEGGGIQCDASSRIALAGCSLTASLAKSGGAILVSRFDFSYYVLGGKREGFATVENCIIAGNTTTGLGGAMGGKVSLTNCTLTGNRSRQGASVTSGDGVMVDCILWDNLEHPPVAKDYYQNPFFAVTGYWADPTDLSMAGDPDDPDAIWVDGDYHLKSQAGRWEPNSQSWVKDNITSPYIDAGDSARPVGDEPSPNGGIINMGAYGGTEEASKSPADGGH